MLEELDLEKLLKCRHDEGGKSCYMFKTKNCGGCRQYDAEITRLTPLLYSAVTAIVEKTNPDSEPYEEPKNETAHIVGKACTKCRAYLPSDTHRDYISEEDVNYCYNCGAEFIKLKVGGHE